MYGAHDPCLAASRRVRPGRLRSGAEPWLVLGITLCPLAAVTRHCSRPPYGPTVASALQVVRASDLRPRTFV